MSKTYKPLARGARLAQLGAGLAGGYFAHQLRRPFLTENEESERRRELGGKLAGRVRDELQNLRGPVMKIGQALSMQTHALGPEWIEALSNLQMQAPPMHTTLMRAQFKSAFGSYPEAIFQSFENQPFAAASLGQVHWAVTKNGEEVAVKIQYPAIREAIESDFALLRMASLATHLTGHLRTSLVKEIRRGILEEADYVHEAANLEHFGKALAPLSFVRVPKVYREYSNERVLTMSRVGGSRLADFLKTNPSQAVRDKIGEVLTRLFFFQLFQVRALHADPHPGNYLFNSDGTVGMVDFGCVKYLKPEVVRGYRQCWTREWRRDEKALRALLQVIFGRKDAARDPGARQTMEEIGRFYDEFHPLDGNDTMLDLGSGRFMEEFTRLAGVLIRNKFLSPDFVFLSRTESGMCNLLHILKARVATTGIVREYL